MVKQKYRREHVAPNKSDRGEMVMLGVALLCLLFSILDLIYLALF